MTDGAFVYTKINQAYNCQLIKSISEINQFNRYLALTCTNQAGVYGRILTEVISADQR